MRRLLAVLLLIVALAACTGPPGAGSGAPGSAAPGSAAPVSSPADDPGYGY